jgi:hypothetical protein
MGLVAKLLKYMADDVVLFEPVCGDEFPANREKNREMCDFKPFSGESVRKNICSSMGCERIP